MNKYVGSMAYNDLKLLSLWLSPSDSDIVNVINDKFMGHSNSTVYYLDATSSFPLREIQKSIPISNKAIYDSIRIIPCLDLHEVFQTLNKVIQLLTMDRIRKQNSENETKDPLEILLLINGLGVMFQNTQIKESASASHLQLRDILLKLRLVANNPQKDGSRLKSVIVLPRGELSKFDSARTDMCSKRFKSSVVDGNTLGEYIAKFYADLII